MKINARLAAGIPTHFLHVENRARISPAEVYKEVRAKKYENASFFLPYIYFSAEALYFLVFSVGRGAKSGVSLSLN